MLTKIKEKLQQASLVVTGVLAGTSVGAYANETLDKIGGQSIAGESSDLNEGGIVDVILNIANILLGIVTALSVIMLIYGAFIWVTGFGADGDGESKGKGIVKNAIVGLIIALLAYTIVAFVGSAFSSEGLFSGLFGN